MDRPTYTIATPCGFVCDSGKCTFYTGKKEPKCLGCLRCEGKPFWGECKVYKCSEEHGIEHCGLCEDFPCEVLPDQFDPSNPKGREEAIFRIGHLAIRAKIGTKKWLEQFRDGKLKVFDIEN